MRDPIRLPLRAFPVLVLLAAGCHYLRTPFILEQANKPTTPGPAHVVSVGSRVQTLTRGHLADGYLHPEVAAAWMTTLAQRPDPLLKLVACLGDPAAQTAESCYRRFGDAVLPASKRDGSAGDASAWDLPALALDADLSALTAPGDHRPAVETEIDAERFASNARALGPSLLQLQRLVGADKLTAVVLSEGLAAGAAEAAGYVTGRRWQRSLDRHSTALVMSGGAANGAFSAGFIWRLLGLLEACRRPGAPAGCADFKLDLVVGASTGALIGVLVDDFFTGANQERARTVLLDSYTCSVPSDLYCVNDTWDWKLAGDLKGLVRFDGIRDRMARTISQGMVDNGTELVTVAVDYETGDLHADSDQDPADRAPIEGRPDVVLASIVEPVMAEPVIGLPRPNGARLPGTFIDGGIRSGLPVMEAVRRGADRVLVLSTGGLDPSRSAPQQNAFQMLFRTIDLSTDQAEFGEIQQAELAAVARRMGEYELCTDRFAWLTTTPARQAAVTKFCERRAVFTPRGSRAEAAVAAWYGPLLFKEVAESWKSEWVLRPESAQRESGYAFEPAVMRPLFELGVRTFQQRCTAVLGVLGLDALAATECAKDPEVLVGQAQAAYRPFAACNANLTKVRTCP